MKRLTVRRRNQPSPVGGARSKGYILTVMETSLRSYVMKPSSALFVGGSYERPPKGG